MYILDYIKGGREMGRWKMERWQMGDGRWEMGDGTIGNEIECVSWD